MLRCHDAFKHRETDRRFGDQSERRRRQVDHHGVARPARVAHRHQGSGDRPGPPSQSVPGVHDERLPEFLRERKALLRESLAGYRDRNRGHEIEVAGVVINNAFYAGGNDGGPEKREALAEIREEAEKNGWYVFKNEIPHSRGFPKMMRGNWNYRGNAEDFKYFASEFLMKIGFPDALDVIFGAGISDLWRRRTRAQSQD